ncbi:MAG: sulfide:quinone oxidoreductase [Baekduia sp.]|nr:sulfide:quinone oxidoreductase [Baekduia sp.]
MPSTVSTTTLRVLIAGGGVAGVECLLGLHDLAGDRVEMTLLTDSRDLHYRPLAVGEPFGAAQARHYPLAATTESTGARLVHGLLDHVDVENRHVTLRDGGRLSYDVLIVALGAVPYVPRGRALAFDVAVPGMLARLRHDVRSGAASDVVIALPREPHWTLPGYELALLLARDAVAAGFSLTVATTEDAPLELLGPVVSAAVSRELADAGVRVAAGTGVELSQGDPVIATLTATGEAISADVVVALPELHAPTTRGLPTTADGFLAVDADGCLIGAPDVYAVGDCTDFPIKQGGLAAQQADIVVEHLAARAGAPVTPGLLHPVLRARMLTGERDLWLRRDLDDVEDQGTVAAHALWWPPDKVAGRWLAPYLAALDDTEAGVPHAAAHGRVIDADLVPAAMPVPRHLDLLGDPRGPA